MDTNKVTLLRTPSGAAYGKLNYRELRMLIAFRQMLRTERAFFRKYVEKLSKEPQHNTDAVSQLLSFNLYTQAAND